MSVKVLISILIFTSHLIESYKILIVSPTPFKSHWIIGSSIGKELAKNGHEVTLIGPFDLKFKNVNSVVLDRDKEG